MPSHGDAGEEIVGRVADRIGLEPDYLTLWRRGLTWYPGGLAQHVWAEAVPRSAGFDRWRIHVRTWCLKRLVGSAEQMAGVASELRHVSLAALVRKPGSPSRFGLASSIYMSAERNDWTADLVAAIARQQAHDALRLTRSLALLATGAAPDFAAARADKRGMRKAPLPPLAFDGPALGRLDALPFGEVAAGLRMHPGTRSIATHAGVTASIALPADTCRQNFILVEIRSATRPGLGAGLGIWMSLPVPAPSHLLHALALNEAELQPDSPTDLIGGWLVRDGALAHEAFLPQPICTADVLKRVADGAARRAAWVRAAGRTIVPGDWPSDARGRVIPFKQRP